MQDGDLLGAFLRTRRARVRPEDVGLPAGGRRRVPGLRREELAAIAGISADYYMRLEQGRERRPSASVLEALARALRLADAEREYLHAVVRSPEGTAVPPPETLAPSVRELLARLDAPALALGRHLDVLAQTPHATALLGDLAGRNLLRAVVLGERARALLPEWERAAEQLAAWVRVVSAERVCETPLCLLTDELLTVSAPFRDLWARHDVAVAPHGTVGFDHPAAGRFTLAYDALTLPDGAQQLLTFTPADAAAEHALARLAGALV